MYLGAGEIGVVRCPPAASFRSGGVFPPADAGHIWFTGRGAGGARGSARWRRRFTACWRPPPAMSKWRGGAGALHGGALARISKSFTSPPVTAAPSPTMVYCSAPLFTANFDGGLRLGQAVHASAAAETLKMSASDEAGQSCDHRGDKPISVKRCYVEDLSTTRQPVACVKMGG